MFEVNLPGTSIHVIDEYNQSVYDSSQFGTTESVLVIGTAFDGPVGKEVTVYNPEHAAYIFGGTYDSTARRSASLTAYVQDVYDKGCRTIYCMRVGGKEISKTYRLKEDLPVFFRVSGAFPSNKYKDMAMLIHTDAHDNRTLTIYKTANKATIEEKREGAVQSSESIISVSINISNPYGINENSNLVDLIEYMNNYVKNNVFKLAITDEKGIDITHNELARTISVGALFDGIYTVGRVAKASTSEGSSLLPVKLTATVPTTVYSGFNGGVLFELLENEDIESMYPVIKKDYDFLSQFGALDTISDKDTVDYEEVNMSNFELYKKLGSGFAQTAMVYNYDSETGRVIIKPTPMTSPLYSMEIAEGIYTTASNLKTDYRILASGYADAKITGPRPTKKDFLKESLNKIPALFSSASRDIAAHAVYKLDDDVVKKYGFKVEVVDTFDLPTIEEIKANLLTDPIKPLADTTVIQTGKYAIVEADGMFWVAKQGSVLEDVTDGNVEGGATTQASKIAPETINILMPASSLANKDEERDFIVRLEKSDVQETIFIVQVLSDYAECTTVAELADVLETSVIGQMFTLVCNNKLANETIGATPTIEADEIDNFIKPNKEVGVNLNIVIPYTTSDNFARQLAQHCEYTSLKTYQTHGVIGVEPLNDTSIKAVTQKSAALVEKDYDLFVKNVVGRPVLGVDNLPYHIGKSITITTIQHSINTLDGYRFTASGQGAYVGRASTLPASTSTTNQVLSVLPHFTYSEMQKVALNKTGYVTAEYRDGVYKVTDGITKAPSYSQFSRFATFRTLKLIDRVIRAATEPFIGKKNNMINRNSMYTAIKSGMDGLLEIHLESYEFSMNYNKYEARLGNININYSVDILNEIRNVTNTVTAKSE